MASPGVGEPPRFLRTPFVAGAVGGCIAAVVTCPLEVVKTRLQAGGGVAGASGARVGFVESARVDVLLRNVFREEGIRGLYRGLGTTVFGIGPVRAVYFTVYKYAKEAAESRGVADARANLVGGLGAGMAAATFGSPIWVVKTRIQIDHAVRSGGAASGVTAAGTGSRVAYASPIDALGRILREEGARGLFRGLSASYLGLSESVTQIVLYTAAKRWVAGRGPSGEPEPLPAWQTFALAAGAKLTASALTYPHEVIRTRLRDHHNVVDGKPTKYTGLVQAFRTVLREEGARGLYAGLPPHLIRVVPNAAILYLAVEVVLGAGNGL
uniref:Mitochondrial carrier protein n=1 Tax=Bicosoecida sp. CB-2014 TaxID=1486930 RepID=A0A7S1CBI5_9STRA|mmetsp:Transcript_18444/g.65300  ORF Transcript_18444/g.65300 Transcript_18444/m.65300 type:complete len:325 (+) Transcript_18444:169-1143(+)